MHLETELHEQNSQTISQTKKKEAMIKILTTLDSRVKKENGQHPLVLRVYLPIGAYVQFKCGVDLSDTQLNSKGEVIRHTDSREINADVARSKEIINKAALALDIEGKLQTAKTYEFRAKVLGILNEDKQSIPEQSDFEKKFIEYISLKSGSTYIIYTFAFNKLKEYCAAINTPIPFFAEINNTYLIRLENYYRAVGLSTNSIGIITRAIKAVFNAAIADDEITNYPFKKYKCPMKKESDTVPLTLEQIRAIRDIKLSGSQELARDLFMLSFYFCGMNAADLYNLDYSDTRVSFRRQKTGVKVSFEIPQEARAIMAKYQDSSKKKMLKFSQSPETLKSISNMELKRIATKLNISSTLYLYVARHSFATLAMQEADLSYSDVAAMLGHANNSITAVYAKPKADAISINLRKFLDIVSAK